MHLDIMSDAAMDKAQEEKGRSGYIISRRHGDISYPINWSARKLRRVARSSTTAEILAAAEAMCMGLYMRAVIAELLLAPAVELTTDSRSLMALATSIGEHEERLKKVDLAVILEEYDNATLHAIHWSPGPTRLTDAITKDNRQTAELLQGTLTSGKHKVPSECRTTLGQTLRQVGS